MAKKGWIENNKKRTRLTKNHAKKRMELKEKIMDKKTTMEERFALQIQLAAMPRNGAKTRIRNRCGLTGRPRGYYRKFNMSRIMLRELASVGQIPGMVKSSW